MTVLIERERGIILLIDGEREREREREAERQYLRMRILTLAHTFHALRFPLPTCPHPPALKKHPNYRTCTVVPTSEDLASALPRLLGGTIKCGICRRDFAIKWSEETNGYCYSGSGDAAVVEVVLRRAERGRRDESILLHKGCLEATLESDDDDDDDDERDDGSILVTNLHPKALSDY